MLKGSPPFQNNALVLSLKLFTSAASFFWVSAPGVIRWKSASSRRMRKRRCTNAAIASLLIVHVASCLSKLITWDHQWPKLVCGPFRSMFSEAAPTVFKKSVRICSSPCGKSTRISKQICCKLVSNQSLLCVDCTRRNSIAAARVYLLSPDPHGPYA